MIHAALQRTSVKLGLLAAITIAIAICLFIAIRVGISANRPTPVLAQPQPGAGFHLARHPTKKTKAEETWDSLAADEQKKIAASLETVRARYRAPAVMRLGRDNQVTLMVDSADPTESADPAGLDVPVEIKVVRRNPVNHVSAQLLKGDADVEVKLVADLGAEQQEVTPGAPVSWTWSVRPNENSTLTLKASTLIKADSRPDPFLHPVGHWDIQINVSIWDRAWHFLDQIGAAWIGLGSLATTIVGMAGALAALHGLGFKLFGRGGNVGRQTEDAGLST